MWTSASFYTHHLQQGQIAGSNVVKVDFHVLPAGALVHQIQAVWLVVDDLYWEDLVGGGVDAVEILSCEQVDAHDDEDEPEDEADQEHIHDGGNCPQKCIHHNLGKRESNLATSAKINRLDD